MALFDARALLSAVPANGQNREFGIDREGICRDPGKPHGREAALVLLTMRREPHGIFGAAWSSEYCIHTFPLRRRCERHRAEDRYRASGESARQSAC